MHMPYAAAARQRAAAFQVSQIYGKDDEIVSRI